MSQLTLFAPADQAQPEPQDNSEWYTPRPYVEAAHECMGGIDLDPASCAMAQRVVQAGTYFTRETNGLAQPWHGRVWLNPPYGRGVIESFCQKLLLHLREGHIEQAIVLTHNCTETGWWQSLARRSLAICYPAERLKFWGPLRSSDNNPRGQTLFYFASQSRVDEADEFDPTGYTTGAAGPFVQVFERFGYVSLARLTPGPYVSRPTRPIEAGDRVRLLRTGEVVRVDSICSGQPPKRKRGDKEVYDYKTAIRPVAALVAFDDGTQGTVLLRHLEVLG